jgi:cation-transporting ATPase F
METRSHRPSSSRRTPGEPWAIPPGEVVSILGSDPRGLTSIEAVRRLERDGPNDIPAAAHTSALRIAGRQFASPLIALLIAAAAVSVLFGEYVDSAVIGAALLLNAAIGFTQEARAERSMESLQRLARSTARVVRDGRERELDAHLLVVGDVVLLEAGMKVPADARIAHATSLEVDESILTGESLPVAKGAESVPRRAPVSDRLCMVFQGTVVSRGTARAVVTAVGTQTELGRIAGAMRAVTKAQTPLQRRMARFARLIGAAVVLSCAVGLVVGLALGEPVDTLVLSLVALAVAAIPEGLPVVFTVALAISMRRMAARRAIIRRLPAVETLGSCSAIGSDKTGTLTRNEMTVQAIVIGSERFTVTGTGLTAGGAIIAAGEPVDAATHEGLARALHAAALCNDAHAVMEGQTFTATGDPTEVALVIAAAKGGIDRDTDEEDHPRVAEIPFDAERRTMATFNRNADGITAYVKGAPEAVLDLCTADTAGRSVDRDRVLADAEDLAHEGMRVLAAASRRVEDDLESHLLEPQVQDLEFLGLFGMLDPPRDEAIAAVAACQSAGIRVVMITGDHGATATAIARRLGIAGSDDRALTGADLDRLSGGAFDAAVENTRVFARVSPQHKLAIVEALHRRGHTVAVTGDGVNDAPALRAADIGVAMGRTGTDVAKEAADMVVTDDDFESIVAAVEEGRIAFDNVRKTTAFLVATGTATIVAVLASIFGRFDAPFVAAQLIWLNVVTNGVQDVGLAFEPGDQDVLDRKPRPRSEGIISPLLWERTILAGLVMAVGTLALFLYELHVTSDVEYARTVALTTMVLFQILHVGNARSEHGSLFGRSPFSNRFLFLGSLVALAIHIGALYWAPTQYVLQVEPLPLGAWLDMLLVASSVLVAVEAHKLVRKPRPSSVRGAPTWSDHL